MTMTMSGCHPRALWVPRRHEGAMGNSVSFTPPPKKKSTPIYDRTFYQGVYINNNKNNKGLLRLFLPQGN